MRESWGQTEESKPRFQNKVLTFQVKNGAVVLSLSCTLSSWLCFWEQSSIHNRHQHLAAGNRQVNLHSFMHFQTFYGEKILVQFVLLAVSNTFVDFNSPYFLPTMKSTASKQELQTSKKTNYLWNRLLGKWSRLLFFLPKGMQSPRFLFFFFRKVNITLHEKEEINFKIFQWFLFPVCKSEYLQNSLYFPKGSGNVKLALFNYVKQQESLSSLCLNIHNSISQ